MNYAIMRKRSMQFINSSCFTSTLTSSQTIDNFTKELKTAAKIVLNMKMNIKALNFEVNYWNRFGKFDFFLKINMQCLTSFDLPTKHYLLAFHRDWSRFFQMSKRLNFFKEAVGMGLSFSNEHFSVIWTWLLKCVALGFK